MKGGEPAVQMNPLNNWEIGKRIQRYRKMIGMSQETLSEALCADPTIISRIENGRKPNLTVDLLILIAEMIGVTLNDLCYSTAGPPTEPVSPELQSDYKEVMQILRSLPETERAFLMKMIRAAV